MKLIVFLSFITLSFNSFAQDAAKGAELYKQCIACHGDKGDGNPALKAPRLSGQYDWYVLKQLQDMKAGKIRKNPAMMPFLAKLSEQDMKDLAAHISKL
jgi:cytochrome c553